MRPLWEGRRVIACVGTGGVGKTSVAAALAMAAAASGRRTLVMTIDPARRLANALGLADFGNVEREVDPFALAEAGVHLRAPLWAMMPDVKRTFDELVERTATSDEQRRRILANPIYEQFARTLVGSQDYAAVEKLNQVYRSGRYDLIVLDTPPAQNVLDFLAAPSRVVTFFDQDTVRVLLKPYLLAGKVSTRLVNLGNAVIYRTLGRFAGGETLRTIIEFLLGFQGMYEGLRERSQQVQELLCGDELAFVLVGTTRTPQLHAMRAFRDTLAGQGLRTRAIILNRARPLPYASDAHERLEHELAARITETSDLARTRHALAEELALATQDAAALATLAHELPDTPVVSLPELPLDVHDLATLALLHSSLLAATDGRGESAAKAGERDRLGS